MSTFLTRGNSFLAAGELREITPATTNTVQLSGGTEVLNTNTGTLAALTFVLPGSGTKGDRIGIKTIGAVTAVTWKLTNGSTTTANGVPAALTANQAIQLRYTTLGWQLW